MKISREDLYGRSDRIAVGFCSLQFETDAVVPSQLIVAKENRRTIVGGQQDVQIAIAIEISVSQSAADARFLQPAPSISCHIMEFPAPQIHKEWRRLGVAHISANVPDGLIDVSIG